MTLEQIFYNTVITSWHLAFLFGFYGLDDIGNAEQFWPRTLLFAACGREIVFPPDPQPLEDALVEARYGGLQLGREAPHAGYAGDALVSAEELIAESRNVIAFSPVLLPDQIEDILAGTDDATLS